MNDAPKLPTLSDFPPRTAFYIKEDDVPLVHLPDNQWFNWFGGKPYLYDVTALRVDNNRRANSFEEWLEVVKESLPRPS
ncbi:hypothetical protein AYO41_02535 [Verrucomicrobia bacterium SCGC AG-212-E04]|nr:hypothetical protein AYO41_02535 [Verrucomicrobia bacterium SCGC AG-212-E04]